MMTTHFTGRNLYKALIIALFCFAPLFLSAEVISFGTHFRPLQNSLETMNVSFSVPQGFERIAVPQKGLEIPIKVSMRPKPKASSMSTTRSFKSTNSLSDEHTEVRHCLFLDTGTTEKSFTREFLVFMLNCSSLIAGRELVMSDFSPISAAEVKRTCKADTGYICYIANPSSRFAAGYNYMMLEFYGKAGTGIVMRATVSNRTDAVASKTGAFIKARNSFSFN